MKRGVFPASVLACVMSVASLQAAQIDFGGLTGVNGDPMPSPYLEDGFSVTPITGDWVEAHNFGNPVPDIFSSSELGVVRVTTAIPGGIFQFSSVDLGDAGGGGVSYILDGLLGGVSVFTTGAGGPLPGGFTTVVSPSGADIDELLITMRRGTTSSYNIDNINCVPEPASMILIALGGLGVLRRRR